MGELFHEGGPHQIKRLGADQYSMTVKIPNDKDGRYARECTDPNCSPGYFKVMGGTGLTNQKEAFCPYCRRVGRPNDFMSSEQKRYAMDILKQQATSAIQDSLRDSLGLGNSNSKRLVDGLVKVDLEFKAGHVPAPRIPLEDILKRDLICPHCGLNHSVYGFAFWCPDCGKDIFTTHVEVEIAVVGAMLSDVDRRAESLGPRVAAFDVENALEDLVSIFEATLKIEVRRFLRMRRQCEETVEREMAGIGNQLQGIAKACALIPTKCDGVPLFADDGKAVAQLERIFQKRHPITHNLGVIDRQYLRRVRAGGEEGTEVHVTKQEVQTAAENILAALASLHRRLNARIAEANNSDGNPTNFS